MLRTYFTSSRDEEEDGGHQVLHFLSDASATPLCNAHSGWKRTTRSCPHWRGPPRPTGRRSRVAAVAVWDPLWYLCGLEAGWMIWICYSRALERRCLRSADCAQFAKRLREFRAGCQTRNSRNRSVKGEMLSWRDLRCVGSAPSSSPALTNHAFSVFAD